MDFFLGLIVGGCGVGAIVLLLFGDREQDIIDEDPTMNTRSRDP